MSAVVAPNFGSHSLSREIEAAKQVVDHVRDLAGNDPDFIRDTIEGETNLLEVMQAVVASVREDEAFVRGLEDYETDLSARKARLKKRIELKRALLASGLDTSGRKNLETAVGTVSLVPIAPKVEVSDESSIPSEFWKASDPKLDRTALKAALKDGRTIPGACLGNGGATVRIS